MRLERLLSLVLIGRIAAFTIVRKNCIQRHAANSAYGSLASSRSLGEMKAVATGAEDGVYTAELEKELGIKDGQLALGIDPNEVLKYIGR